VEAAVSGHTTDIAKLIERLEGAKAGSRELDALVFEAATGQSSWLEVPGYGEGVTVRKAISGLPEYTSSIDAALTLVPEGAEYSISTLYGVAWIELPLNCGDGESPHFVRRKDGNVPLALCIASLKARQT
jgi:hypothetical protein